MIKDLIKLADHLDRKGFAKEADYLDQIIKSAKDDGSYRVVKTATPYLDNIKTIMYQLRDNSDKLGTATRAAQMSQDLTGLNDFVSDLVSTNMIADYKKAVDETFAEYQKAEKLAHIIYSSVAKRYPNAIEKWELL